MGNSKEANRRQGICLPRPRQRLNDWEANSERQRQKQSRAKATKLATNVLCLTLVPLDVKVKEKEVKKAFENIIQSVINSMYVLLNFKCKKYVMLKVLSNPWIFKLVPKIVGKLVSKLMVVQKEVIRGSMKSLDEVKMPFIDAKLATKLVLLIAIISFKEFLLMVKVWICKLWTFLDPLFMILAKTLL